MLNLKKLSVAVLLLIAMPLTGCFGKFNLVRTVYKLNQAPKNKFVQSILTWVLIIVPVYGLAAFGDFILLNLIEFWSGSNPINASHEHEDGTQVVMRSIETAQGTSLEALVMKDGEVLNRVVFDKIDDIAMKAQVSTASGEVLGTHIEAAFDLSVERRLELASAF